jgi:NADH:ubiquinone oxidoreductase subunit B-like Fe-S oxidoreductase
MNPRIQELYTQALENKFDYGGGRGVKPGEYYSNYKTVLNAEKFAELIVRECADVGSKFSMAHPEAIRSQIKRHFGVE